MCSWINGLEAIRDTFGRFALPINWDFTEVAVCSETAGGYFGAIEWVGRFISHVLKFAREAGNPSIVQDSAIKNVLDSFDVILTDPPYYDAIPYAVM